MVVGVEFADVGVGIVVAVGGCDDQWFLKTNQLEFVVKSVVVIHCVFVFASCCNLHLRWVKNEHRVKYKDCKYHLDLHQTKDIYIYAHMYNKSGQYHQDECYYNTRCVNGIKNKAKASHLVAPSPTAITTPTDWTTIDADSLDCWLTSCMAPLGLGLFSASIGDTGDDVDG